jgi:CDK inhibitor PHO81
MYGRRALHYASMHGKDSCVSFMLSSGAMPNPIDLDNFEPMTYAIVGGHCECVQRLLEVVNVSLTPSMLCLACEYGRTDIATLLLANGCRPDNHDDGLSPLHLSARQGNLELCKLLIQHSVDINLLDTLNGWSPIFYAAVEGSIDCVKLLLNAGCKIDIKDEHDWYPWTYAIYHGHADVANVLELSITPTIISNSNSKSVDSKFMPMAPSALFDEVVDINEVDIDAIPSLLLPPPIIPFRI